jgi:hypothetical protein
MGLLNPAFTVPVTRHRPVYDSRGNDTADTSGDITLQAVVAVDPAFRRPGTVQGKEDRFFQDATVFVPRGSDIAPGDRLLYNTWAFIVAGRPRGDQLHPFTGDDFGWMSFRCQSAG